MEEIVERRACRAVTDCAPERNFFDKAPFTLT
jgi:hypothetical protein